MKRTILFQIVCFLMCFDKWVELVLLVELGVEMAVYHLTVDHCIVYLFVCCVLFWFDEEGQSTAFSFHWVPAECVSVNVGAQLMIF